LLESRIAVGGTAEVYIAKPIDPQALPSKLIVKRLLPHFVADAEGRTMFEREAALHAAVHHENVVQVFGFGVHDGEPWIAMEYVSGCDLYRLLRRLAMDGRKLSIGSATHVACDVLRALESVHAARDETDQPLGIIHRDVTPSNLYLSTDGGGKLGDFGIARSATRATIRTDASAMLKGKFAYLAPEQVAGEPFDQRADLFSVAVVLSEMLLGKQLFAGSGQLAVLLAIRDCRIDPLREVRATLPKGLFELLEHGLARDPSQRFSSATDFLSALRPFDPTPEESRAELGALVRWVQSAPSIDQMPAVRELAAKLRAPTAPPEQPADSQRTTGEYAPIPSVVLTQNGEKLGPWQFARLVEAISTGEVGRGDQVSYMGRGLQPIESLQELSRFLPTRSVTTNRVDRVGAPDFVDEVSVAALVTVLMRVVESEATGVLFADATADPRRGARSDSDPAPQGEGGRKELYFVDGKLHHVASNNASELLGVYVARRGMISREELDFALAVLPRYGGRMGDTLIALGLVGSLDIFRAIRDQGRDRLIDIFQWRTGTLTFFAGQAAPHVEFPLGLEIPPILLAGMEAAQPGEIPVEKWRSRFDDIVGPPATLRPQLRGAAWPPLVKRLLAATEEPVPLREVLAAMAHGGGATASDVLRALELLLSVKLLAWQ
jgi:serine/threonine-protein kinase